MTQAKIIASQQRLFDRLAPKLGPLVDRPDSPHARQLIALACQDAAKAFYHEGDFLVDEAGKIPLGQVKFVISFEDPRQPEISVKRA